MEKRLYQFCITLSALTFFYFGAQAAFFITRGPATALDEGVPAMLFAVGTSSTVMALFFVGRWLKTGRWRASRK